MVDNQDELFVDVNFKNKTKSKPLPDKVKDIDTHNYIYDNIIEAQDNSTLNTAEINNFTSISKSRDTVYGLLDMMGNDPVISSALEIYASDSTEPNDQGRVMWVESDDRNVSGAVEQILDILNVDKNAYQQVYALCKYGDIYLRLYRQSEFEFDAIKDRVKDDIKRLNESVLSDEEKKQLKEDIILKMYSKNDKYSGYAEMVKNPAEVFDLTKFGKTCGYIKTHIKVQNQDDNKILPQFNNSIYSYKFNTQDVDIYGATEFAHGCLVDNSDRAEEEISLINDNVANYKDDPSFIYDYNYFNREHEYNELNGLKGGSNSTNSTSTGSGSMSFSVKRGKSVLYDSFKTWRELNLLENSVLMNRLTKSSILRTINVEIGDMGKTEAQTLLRRIKTMVEQKSAYNINTSMQDYINPTPAENILYFPIHNGIGAVSTAQIGGDVEVGDLNDLDYWKKKLFASLGIPGQYLGDTDDATGFNGGTSLSLISSRYAKTIKRIQNAYIQLYTDVVNLMLLDKGLSHYINKFSLHMQSPSTQEEKDRRENMSNAINNVREVMSLLDEIEDKQVRLEILKSLLSNVITNQEVIGFIEDEIAKLEQTEEDEISNEDYDNIESDTNFDIDIDTGGGSDELPSMDELEVESEPLEFEAPEAPEESFYNGEGELLNEDNDLPSFFELEKSFTDVR